MHYKPRIHSHKFTVIKNQSVWGLANVNAVMECRGKKDGKKCGKRYIKLVPLSELEKKGNRVIRYYYTPRPGENVEDAQRSLL